MTAGMDDVTADTCDAIHINPHFFSIHNYPLNFNHIWEALTRCALEKSHPDILLGTKMLSMTGAWLGQSNGSKRHFHVVIHPL